MKNRDYSKMADLLDKVGKEAFLKKMAELEQERELFGFFYSYAPDYVTYGQLDVFHLIDDLGL